MFQIFAESFMTASKMDQFRAAPDRNSVKNGGLTFRKHFFYKSR